MNPLNFTPIKPWLILATVAVIAGSSGLLGYTIGSAMKSADLQGQIVNLTEKNGLVETSLANCQGGVRALEQATLSAGRAREQAETMALELSKRNRRVINNVKTIKASGCLDMVGKLIEVSK